MADPRITITAVDRTKAAFASALKNLDDLKDKSAKTVKEVSSVGVALKAFSSAFTLGAFAAFIRSGIDTADSLGKMSEKIGVSIESLTALQYAARQSGVSAEELAGGLRQLAKNAADTEAGTGEARLAFRALGIDVTDTAGKLKATDALLLEISERFSKLEDGPRKTALAMRIFGDAGAQMIPLLNQGRAGFEAMREEAERLGLVLDSKAVKAATEFNDNLTRLRGALEGVKFELAKGVLPTLSKFVEQMVEGVKIAGSFSKALALFGTINPFRDIPGNIKATREEIVQLERALEKAQRSGREGFARELQGRIDNAKKQLEFLKFMQRQAIETGDPSTFDARDLRSRQGGRETAPALPDEAALREAAKKAAEAEKERQRLIQMGNAEWVRYIDEQIERERELAEAAHKAAMDRAKADEEARKKSQELAASYIDLIDPIQKYRKQLEEVRTLVAQGFMTQEQGLEAEFAIQLQIDAINNLSQEVEKTKSFAEELGLTFASAFEDAVVAGKKFSEVLKGIGQDIVRMFTRISITEPAADFFKSLNFGKMFGFADGGIMTSAGPLPLRRYASGGIASSPQLALFGEGSRPEAYVPLPDGRSIPVKMQGGGTVVQVIDQRRGGEAPSVSRSTGADGRQLIRVLIRDEVRAAMADGSMDRTLRSNFGVRRRPV